MSYDSAQKEAIYRDYHDKVFGYVISKVLNKENAEDLTSEIFLKIYEKLDTFDDTKASISTWIYTVTRNTMTDYYRTRKVFDEVAEEIPDETNNSIEEEICNTEMLEILAEGLKTLEERERDIIIFRYYKNESLKDIADKMGISYAYVRILHNKALSNLRPFFEK